MDQDPNPTPKHPQRCLEDEQDHLQRGLKLSDFEVRGTLGIHTFDLFKPGANGTFTKERELLQKFCLFVIADLLLCWTWRTILR